MKQTKKANGTNGHAQSNPEILAMLTKLAGMLQQPAAPAVAPTAVPKVRKARAVKAAPVAVDPDHVHTTDILLEAYIPDAEQRSGKAGKVLYVRVACACGCVGTLEIPAADAEIMAQSAAW